MDNPQQQTNNAAQFEVISQNENQQQPPSNQQAIPTPSVTNTASSNDNLQQQSNVNQTNTQTILANESNVTTNQQYTYPSANNVSQQQQTQSHTVSMPTLIRPLLEPSDDTVDLPGVAAAQTGTPVKTSPLGLLAQRAVITKVKLTDELNIFEWFKTTDIINQIAEKARSSVGSVITTLDPGMKEYLYSGGNVNVMLITDSKHLVSPIRDSFQTVFGRATVAPAAYEQPTKTLEHPIKLASSMQNMIIVAKEKIRRLRLNTNTVPQNQVIAIIQPGFVSQDKIVPASYPTLTSNGDESQTSEFVTKWFLTYCMLIEDPVLKLTLNTFSQFIPIDEEIIESATKESLYPNDFNDKHLGFTIPINQLMGRRLQSNRAASDDDNSSLWLEEWSGYTETQIVQHLGLSIANAYRRKWNDCVQIETMSS